MVGSSSSSNSGELISERAMVSRRFIPPDSVSTLASAFSTNCANSSNSAARRRHSAREMPK